MKLIFRRRRRRAPAMWSRLGSPVLLLAAALLGIGLALGAMRRPRPASTPRVEEERELFDTVEEASAESFPASDPPAWTGTSI